MNPLLVLYHGSERIIDHPSLEAAKKNNDYGPGFYMTEDIELAKEWACKNHNQGIVNEYLLDTTGLKVLDLSSRKYTPLHWLALLLNNRIFRLDNDVAVSIKKLILKQYLIDISQYDMIIGYRADDCYFDYAQSFLSNSITYDMLVKAIKLGNLGLQTVIVSSKAFKRLHNINIHYVNEKIYYPKFINRDLKARQDYRRLKSNIYDGQFASDMIKKGVINESI